VHHYGFLGWPWILAGAGVSLLLFALGWFGLPAGAAKHPVPLMGIVAIAGGSLFWLARERTYFLGDGGLLIEGMKRSALLWHNEPGALFGHLYLNRLLGVSDPAVTFAVVSVVCGVLFLLVAGLFARTIAEDPAGRLLAFGTLVLAGFTRLFYGYVETYPLLAVLASAYLVLGVRYLRGRGPLFPVVLLGTAIPFIHTTGVLLWPSLLFVLWRGAPEESRPRRLRLLAFLLPLGLLGAGVAYLQVSVAAVTETYAAYFAKFLPLTQQESVRIPYSLLSGAHLSDFFQEQMLLGPFGALALILLLALGVRARWGAEGRFLAVAGVWWLFSFFYNRELGAARDWDLFAVASIPVVMLVALTLSRLSVDRSRLAAAMAGVVFAVSGFHMLAWVAVDADSGRSVIRFLTLFRPEARVSAFARSYALEEVGMTLMDAGDSDRGLILLRGAAEADSLNLRAAGNLGFYLNEAGQSQEAIELLERAARIGPTREQVHLELARAYEAVGRLEDSMNRYQIVLDFRPGSYPAILNLARLERRIRHYDHAQQLLLEALQYYPDDPVIHGHLGQVFLDQGNREEAAESYRRALALNPREVTAAYNLGLILLQEGNPAEAAPLFEAAVGESPAATEAWINLGTCRFQLKDHDGAERAYLKAFELAPERAEPYFGLFQNQMARGDTLQAFRYLELYAARDSTSELGLRARELIRRLSGR
jgi:tetratricopeptide (TPR) repeat protein